MDYHEKSPIKPIIGPYLQIMPETGSSDVSSSKEHSNSLSPSREQISHSRIEAEELKTCPDSPQPGSHRKLDRLQGEEKAVCLGLLEKERDKQGGIFAK